SARDGGQGFSLRRTDRTPQTASSQAAGANPRRTPLIGKRAIYGWKLVHTFLSVSSLHGMAYTHAIFD
ncbi:MAG: hypothetical protein ABUK14_05795, partial [Desulfobacteria bacterium]